MMSRLDPPMIFTIILGVAAASITVVMRNNRELSDHSHDHGGDHPCPLFCDRHYCQRGPPPFDGDVYPFYRDPSFLASPGAPALYVLSLCVPSFFCSLSLPSSLRSSFLCSSCTLSARSFSFLSFSLSFLSRSSSLAC